MMYQGLRIGFISMLAFMGVAMDAHSDGRDSGKSVRIISGLTSGHVGLAPESKSSVTIYAGPEQLKGGPTRASARVEAGRAIQQTCNCVPPQRLSVSESTNIRRPMTRQSGVRVVNQNAQNTGN